MRPSRGEGMVTTWPKQAPRAPSPGRPTVRALNCVWSGKKRMSTLPPYSFGPLGSMAYLTVNFAQASSSTVCT